MIAVAALRAMCADDARADLGFGPVTLSGSLSSQNIVRHPDVDEYHFIQQRNTAWLGAEWDLVRDQALRRRLDLSFAQDARLRLLYRGVYDSVYDYTPIFRERDLRGRKPSRAAERDLADLSRRARDALKCESDLREAYVDLKLRRYPLAFRVGKQQIVWGEADLFRMLDRANPLDTSWHFIEEIPPPAFGWDELRIPLWMLDARWEIGTVGPLSTVVGEMYWNPGDWRPIKVAFLPRPWGIRLPHPLTNREDGAFLAPFSAQRLSHSSLFKQGDYRRNPAENSQIGVRVSGSLPGALRVGVYYFYQRWAGDDGTPFASLRGMPDDVPGRVRTQALIQRGTLPVEYVTPYIHTVGLSASYFAARLQANLRVETVYDFGLPLFDRAKTTTFAPLLPGVTERDYWKGMLAFDRPVIVPFVNAGSAVFLTGQWFVHHLMHNEDSFTGPLDLPTAGRRPRPFCGSPPTEPCPDPHGNGSFRDDIRSWESLVTVAAFTAYRGGTVAPVVGLALDPVNSFAMNVFWDVDWVLTPAVVVNVAQRYFASVQGDVLKGPFNPWVFGTMRGRSETAIRLTYRF
jgi:hypothetical protein